MITADHKVLSDNCESRNNHQCAVVVQDLATHWIQSYLCKNKTSQENQRSLQKILEPDRNPKVIYTDNSLEFGQACEVAVVARGMGSPRHATNRRRRTRKGPEPACVRAPFGLRGGTRKGRRMNLHPAVVLSCRRGNTSSETQRRKSRAARKGKWPPRGTGDDSPHLP